MIPDDCYLSEINVVCPQCRPIYPRISLPAHPMRTLETKIPPVLLTVLLGLAAFSLSKANPESSFSFVGQFVAGGICLVTGVLISLLGVKAFQDHRTTVNPTTPESTSQIVCIGVYRHTRNPMYVGFGLVLLAAVLFMGNAASFLVIPVYVVYITHFQIKPEERALLAKFGAPYREYMASVRRWL